MTIPLLLSVVVAGASALFPPKNQDGFGTAAPASSRAARSPLPGFVGNQMFLAGIVMGMSFSWLLTSELRRSRVQDRIRLALLDWLRPLLTPTNEPDPPSTPRGAVFRLNEPKENGNERATVSSIISPRNSLTSSLWVSTIRIPPQHELKCQKANGMEFFYVLQGKGEWDMATRTVTTSSASNSKLLVQGDSFVVEANSSRWIANSSSTEDLVLLRSSDAGFNHGQKDYDQIISLSNDSGGVLSTRAVSAMMTSSVQQAADYFNSLFGNTS